MDLRCAAASSQLAAGDYFGEMALLLEEPRHANVIAMEEVTTLTLNREQFVQLLGPLRDLLDRQMRIRVLKRFWKHLVFVK